MDVQFPVECADGYLEWYLTVSQLCIIPPREHIDDARPSHVGPSNDVPPLPLPPHDADDAQRLQMITFIMDNLIGLVNPDGEVYNLASEATYIASEGTYLDLIIIFCIICIITQ